MTRLPDLNLGNPRDPIDKRTHFGITQIQLGLLDGCVTGINSSFGPKLRLGVIVQLALRNRLRSRFGDVTLHIECRGPELCLCLSELRLGLVQQGLEWAGINFKQ